MQMLTAASWGWGADTHCIPALLTGPHQPPQCRRWFGMGFRESFCYSNNGHCSTPEPAGGAVGCFSLFRMCTVGISIQPFSS